MGGRAQEARDAELDSSPPESGVEPRSIRPYIVLVGLDLSEPGGRAWRFAFDLAKRRGEAEIHAVVLGARELAPSLIDVFTPGAEQSSNDGPSSAPPLKVLQHRSAGGQARLMAMHFRAGRADREILRLAEELGADLIVVASHPPTTLERLMGGTTAERIAQRAPCRVVVVKPKKDENDAGLVEYEPRRTG
jgi:nucleotide-binding universal stress UspA family protein